MTVVGAEDLDDGVAAGEGARNANGVHCRLGAGVDIAPLRQPEPSDQLFTDDDRVLNRRREVRPSRYLALHGLDDGRMGVALDHRSEAVVEIDHLIAVDVPDLRSMSTFDIDRPRVAHLI